MTTVANNDRSAGFTYSSRSNPCPICNRTKDGDCRWKDNGGLVLCHTGAKQDISVSGYVCTKLTSDSRCMQYVLKTDSTKQYTKNKTKTRKKVSEKEYYYPDITTPKLGVTITPTALPNDVYTPLVKVQRIDYINDNGDNTKKFYQHHWDGTKWINGLPKERRDKIHLYQIKHPVNQHAKMFGLPLLIVEGEGIVELLLEMGIAATTSIGGSGSWTGYGYCNYKEDLGNAKVVICPDKDTKGLEYCEDIAKDFPNAEWLYAFPVSPLWEKVPESKGLDIADWLADYKLTKEQILAEIEPKRLNVSSAVQAINKLESSSTNGINNNGDGSSNGNNNNNGSSSKESKLVTLAKQFKQVEDILGNRLRYNTIKRQVELDGVAINPDRVYIQLAVQFNIQLTKGNALNIVTQIAEKHSYSPIQEKVLAAYAKYGNSTIELMATSSVRYLNTTNYLHDMYLRKLLIALIARAFQPGCKMDTVFILAGKQGIGKSTFFSTLVGKEWFDDSLGQVSDKDERLKLHNHWLIEWAELETVFKRRDFANVKAFISCSIDNLRAPYERLIGEYKRPSVIVGSTNLDAFLGDATGNRRFWVVPVVEKINVGLLQDEHEQLLAAAYTLYLSGEKWYLENEAEEQLSDDNTKDFEDIDDPWHEKVVEYLSETTEITIPKILEHCLDIEPAKHTKSLQNRVAEILKKENWGRVRKMVAGKQRRAWEPLF